MKGSRLYTPRNIVNLKDMLNQSANLFKDKPAFVLKESELGAENPVYKNISYLQFKTDVDSLGTALLDLGLKNENILLISDNRYQWAVSYLSIVCGTGVVVPLDRALPENEIISLSKRSYSKAIIFEKKYLETIEKMMNDNTIDIKYYICMDDIKHDGIIYLYDLINKGTELINQNNLSFINANIDNEKMSMMLFTSGTTAISKAVMLSHKNICTNMMDTVSVVKVTEKDFILSFLPLHHTFECLCGFLLPIYVGATIAYCDGIKYITNNLKEYPVTGFTCVPILFENMYRRLIKTIKKQNKYFKFRFALRLSDILSKFGINIQRKLFKDVYDVLGKNLRFFVCGAAPLDKVVAKTFVSLGINFVQGYGLTETSPILAGENDATKDAGTVGFPFPSIEIEIDNPNENGVGEIKARGDSVMLGYFENKEATDEVLKDGWFYTGDLGYFNKRNHLVIAGRKKNVIVLKNGKNIYPEELEVLINKIPGVKESMVYGKTKNTTDLEISVKIVYDKEFYKEVTEEQIKKQIHEEIQKINKQMPPYKYIRDIIVTDKELIKTTTQKIKRFEELKTLNQ